MGVHRVDRVEVPALLDRLHGIGDGHDFRRQPRHLGAADRGADQHQPRHPFGIGERKIDRQRPAQRCPHENRSMNIQRLQHGLEVFQMRKPFVGRIRLPKPAPIIGDTPKPGGRHRFELVLPHAPVANPGMQKHHRNPLPGFQPGENHIVDFKGEGLCHFMILECGQEKLKT